MLSSSNFSKDDSETCTPTVASDASRQPKNAYKTAATAGPAITI